VKAADAHPFWTVQATADRLGLSASSVARLAQRGQLVKVAHPGIRRVTITADSIDAYEAALMARARRLEVIEGAIA
jgi:hypothetical protein